MDGICWNHNWALKHSIKPCRNIISHWQFKHPQPEDFKKVLEESSGKNLDSVFSLLDKKGILPNQQRKGLKQLFF